MSLLVVFTEESSTEVVIEHLAARIAPERPIKIIAHSGKDDLRTSFPRKIRAWRHPVDVRFLIIMDKDRHPNCLELKSQLVDLVPPIRRSVTKVRIVMSCLEAWYLSDPEALCQAGLIQSKIAERMVRERRFREPEELPDAKEQFFRLHKTRGQRALARQIGPYLNPDRSRAISLKHVASVLQSDNQGAKIE